MKTEAKALKLSIKERVILPEILPQQGSKLQQIIVRSLLAKIEFTPAEIKSFEMNFTAKGISWNEKAHSEKFSVELSEPEVSVLKEAAAALDKEARVTQHNLSLVEKIESL